MMMNWAALCNGGVPIPALERRITQADMVAYAGATWDWHLLHYDTEFAKTLGISAPIVDGQVFGALMVECLQDWLGPQAWVSKMSFRFKTPVAAGALVRCNGETVESGAGELHCTMSVTVVDDSGQLVATAAVGEATVVKR